MSLLMMELSATSDILCSPCSTMIVCSTAGLKCLGWTQRHTHSRHLMQHPPVLCCIALRSRVLEGVSEAKNPASVLACSDAELTCP